MWHHKTESTREQLIDARTKIVAQLGEMYNPPSGLDRRFTPDYSSEIAELEAELREIDELLNTKGGPDAGR